MKCVIADFNIDFSYDIQRTEPALEEYKREFDSADVIIEVSEKDKNEEAQSAEVWHGDGQLTFFVCLRKLASWIPLNGAFVCHSACFDVDGVGVAFAAHSGTGKTTHMNLWQKLLGDRMTVVNGDKPIVRFFDDEPKTPYAYGTPWNGKEHLGCNMRTPLKHICFIERSETNFVEKLDKAEAINRIFNQVYKPKDPIAVMNTMTLIDRLLSCCNLWIIHCNMEDDAAETAYNAIFNS